MESMKSLNKSLPKSPHAKSAQPPEQLLQAFRSAALSVTNLYKTAAADQAQARILGYQDALDSLLSFLDKENIGIGDGEGRKVRKWATERLDGSPPTHIGSDSDEDHGEAMKRRSSASPTIMSTIQRKSSQEPSEIRRQSRSSSPAHVISATQMPPTSMPQPNTDAATSTETFSFRSPYPYPSDAEMQTDSVYNTAAQPESLSQATGSIATPAVRVEVMPRGSRTPHRNGNHSGRHNTRSATSARAALGTGAGSKRRIAFNDYFDLGSLGDGREGFGGNSKRGRFI